MAVKKPPGLIRRFVIELIADALKAASVAQELRNVNDSIIRLREQRVAERLQKVEEKTDKTHAEIVSGFASTLALAKAIKHKFPELFK